MTDVEDNHGELLNRNGPLFRGVSLSQLEQALSSMPFTTGTNLSNEFGPAIYVTPNLAHAKLYTGKTGAFMVFQQA